MTPETINPSGEGIDPLDELRAGGRPDSKGTFSIDYEKKNARAWEMAQSIEGVLDKVGFEIICDAVREVLRDIDSLKIKKVRPWDYPPEKELRDVQARAEFAKRSEQRRAEAARWAEQLGKVLEWFDLDLAKKTFKAHKTDLSEVPRLIKKQPPIHPEDHLRRGLIIANLVRELAPYRVTINPVESVDYATRLVAFIGEYGQQSLKEVAIAHPELDWMTKEIKGYPQLRLFETRVGIIGNKIFQEASKRGILIDSGAKKMLHDPEYEVSPKQERLSFIQVSVRELGLTDGATLERIYARAKEMGLRLCPPDTGPSLFFNSNFIFTSLGSCFVGMELLYDRIFHLFEDYNGRIILSDSARLETSIGWVFGPNENFIFVR